jgi:hypothetical protein
MTPHTDWFHTNVTFLISLMKGDLTQPKLVQIQLLMNLFMNLFKFNLFKFCSNYVLKFEHVHEQFMKSSSCSEQVQKK